MLLQFAVENFRSIADRVVLSFLAVEGEDHPEGQVIDVPGIGGVLRSIVLYGPNAAGKSTLVKAFDVVKRVAVKDGVPAGQPIPGMLPHRLRADLQSAPSCFEVELVLDGVHYAYGLCATHERVEREWLHVVKGPNDHPVFERTSDAGITIGPALTLDASRTAFYSFVAEGTRPEQPFLAELYQRNAHELKDLFEYFVRSSVELPDFEWREQFLNRLYARWPGQRSKNANMLWEAGTGVVDIQVQTGDPEVRERLAEGLSESDAAQAAKDGSIVSLFMHEGPDGRVGFRLDDLSDGTRRLLNVSSAIDFGDFTPIAWIDEVDRSLHTQVTKYLIQRVNRAGTHRQCVFTTHDTNLLDAGVFGRDAIWFVEKDAGGATHIYSLAEFDKTQLDQLTGQIEEGYLQGRFGAVPFASDPVKLGWARP